MSTAMCFKQNKARFPVWSGLTASGRGCGTKPGFKLGQKVSEMALISFTKGQREFLKLRIFLYVVLSIATMGLVQEDLAPIIVCVLFCIISTSTMTLWNKCTIVQLQTTAVEDNGRQNLVLRCLTNNVSPCAAPISRTLNVKNKWLFGCKMLMEDADSVITATGRGGDPGFWSGVARPKTRMLGCVTPCFTYSWM